LISEVENKKSVIKSSGAVLHRAPLVMPMDRPPIEDGGVLCRNGVILEAGHFAALRAAADLVIDHVDCVIIPALVNAHTHLELSHLAGLGQAAAEAPFEDIIGWIAALLRRRETDPVTHREMRTAAHASVADLHRTGTLLVADIGNGPASLAPQQEGGIEVHFLLELLGLSRAAVRAGYNRLAQLDPATICTAHAPYSTAPELIRVLKERGVARGDLFSIHVAESTQEIELLMTGGGPFRMFLEERGVWDGSFVPPATGAVEYLDRLGVLDSRTLCVHSVHITDAEIQLLAARQAKVCLCPGSNRTLRTGRAPVGKLLAAGILPALGTDSLASNQRLDLWREMQLLREDHPAIDPERIFAMATSGGAAAVGAGDRLGSLSPGKSSRMLAVHSEIFTTAGIFDYLTNFDHKAQITWLN
jgi:aminodeoxyfutalosine deaminase